MRGEELPVDTFLVILLIVALVKFVFFGIVLLTVFKPDLKDMGKKREAKKHPSTPVCMYCQSRWTHAVDEGETRWDGDSLVLVTTYECQHCQLPFWHVERVPAGTLKG